jgi:hypothetical protein
MSTLARGSLVRWPGAPGQPVGVIVAVDASRVEVLFASESERKIFAAKAGVLESVVFPQTVVRRSEVLVEGDVAGDPDLV